MRRNQIRGTGASIPQYTTLLAGYSRSKTVLAFQPGTRWEYGRSTDMLGRIVEVVSGMSLEQFFQTRIFQPLGMVDTYFSLTADKVSRVAWLMLEPATGKRPNATDPRQPQRFEPGGGGLFSTAADCLRFTSMQLNGGELDGVHLPAPKTVEHMASDYLGYVPGDRRVYYRRLTRNLLAQTLR